jgi:hypothetical protein
MNMRHRYIDVYRVTLQYWINNRWQIRNRLQVETPQMATYNAAQPRSSKLPMDSTAVFQIPIWPDMQCGDDRYMSSNGFGVLE